MQFHLQLQSLQRRTLCKAPQLDASALQTFSGCLWTAKGICQHRSIVIYVTDQLVENACCFETLTPLLSVRLVDPSMFAIPYHGSDLRLHRHGKNHIPNVSVQIVSEEAKWVHPVSTYRVAARSCRLLHVGRLKVTSVE